MAETGIPKTQAVITGTAITDHNAHVHEYEVNYTCALKRTALLSLPNEATTRVTFPTGSAEELADPLNWHSLSIDPERITVTATGLYLFSAFLLLYDLPVQNVFTSPRIELNASGGLFVADMRYDLGGYLGRSISAVATLSSGDFVELDVYIEGADANVKIFANQCYFSVTLLRQ